MIGCWEGEVHYCYIVGVEFLQEFDVHIFYPMF